MVMTMPTGEPRCPHCGDYMSPAGHYCGAWNPQVGYGQYTFTPTPLTEADIRRIIREELSRLALPQEASR